MPRSSTTAPFADAGGGAAGAAVSGEAGGDFARRCSIVRERVCGGDMRQERPDVGRGQELEELLVCALARCELDFEVNSSPSLCDKCNTPRGRLAHLRRTGRVWRTNKICCSSCAAIALIGDLALSAVGRLDTRRLDAWTRIL